MTPASLDEHRYSIRISLVKSTTARKNFTETTDLSLPGQDTVRPGDVRRLGRPADGSFARSGAQPE